MAKLRDRIAGKIQQEKNNRIIAKAREELAVSDFSIISQNCIGGVFYHDMGMEFLSPTINLYIPEPDFVRMVLNLREYMEAEIDVSWGDGYPLGILGEDVEIHFLHYTSCEEALEKWNSRKQRIKWDRIIVFATDRDGFTEDVYSLWKEIEYPKLIFTACEKYLFDNTSLYFREYESDGMVPDLIPERKFYKAGLLVAVINKLF